MRGTALLVGSLLAGLVLGTITGGAVARTADGPERPPAAPVTQSSQPGCAPTQPVTTPPLPAPGPAPAPRLAA
ncbi:hypothetical protein ACFC58_03045 [Kitasatospora purpeofusca]|uniref:hypothetical protein n=1 Tax=Kitasatospora purpeofusca TaxID=67352 RepID=UPI0035DEA26B